MTNTIDDSFNRLEDSVTEMLNEADNSNNPVFRCTTYGMTKGMMAGFVVTALTAGYLTFRGMTGGAEHPSIPLYIISGMNSVIMGVGAGTFGMLGGSIIGAAIGATKGSLDYVVERIKK